MRRLQILPLDWFVLLVPIILGVTGIITVYSTMVASGRTSLAVSQGVFLLLGLLTMCLFLYLDYRNLRAFAWPIFFGSLAILVLLIPAIGSHLPFTPVIYGARRWISFGFFQLQPGEITKLAAVIIAAELVARRLDRKSIGRLVAYLLVAALPVGLILAQPDLGTAAVVAVIFLAVLLASGLSRQQITALIAFFLLVGALLFANLHDYQRARLETFLNPASDPLRSGYNVRQSLIAVGSGGLLGRGFGQGSQTALNFLPVAHTDFLFASFAEATGLIGSSVIIALYSLLIWRAVAISQQNSDPFATYLALGIAVKIFFQVTVNIGMNIGLLPVTGIPLPFMSSGGTALIIDFACVGILLGIYARHRKSFFV